MLLSSASSASAGKQLVHFEGNERSIYELGRAYDMGRYPTVVVRSLWLVLQNMITRSLTC
jgi:hypothetical protein